MRWTSTVPDHLALAGIDDAHAAWVEQCSALAPQLAARTLALLDSPYDGPAVQTLFAGADDGSGLPVRATGWAS